MATIPVVIQEISTRYDRGHIASWNNLADGDDGEPIEFYGNFERSVQVEGTFGPACKLAMEGSNDGVNYRTILDYNGTGLEFKFAKVAPIVGCVRYVRPRVTAGTGSNLTVTMFLKYTRI